MRMAASNGDVSEALAPEGWGNEDHIFILSTSGKPVYSRYGSEERLATLSGVMQALVSFVQSSNDSIRRVKAGHTTIEFLVIEPLTLVAVSHKRERDSHLQNTLKQLHNLVVFILSSWQLDHVYKERKNFDLRRLLAGSERVVDFFVDSMPYEPAIFAQAVPCLAMEAKARCNIAGVISQACDKLKDPEACGLVYGLLIMDRRVVCLIHIDRYRCHPNDTHLLINLIASSESFKSAETWSPLCLPHFNADKFLHAYISYLAEDCEACLLLLTVKRDVFHLLSEAKKRIVEKLRRSGQLDVIGAAKLAKPVTCCSLNIPYLRHFLYILTDLGSYFWPAFTAPYNGKESRISLINAYRRCHTRLNEEGLKVLYVLGENEVVYGYRRDNVQLFLVLEPLTSPEEAADCKNKVMTWLGKQDDLVVREDFVF